MADLLDDLETYFTSLNIVTPGTIFKDTLPDLPDSAIAIYCYSGYSSLPQIAGVNYSIQIVVRDKSATVAKSKAKELYNALLTEDGILYLTPERWSLVFPRQVPFKIKVDTKERIYYGFNADITTYAD